jgi:alpha-L-arabinofuranosidase
VKTSVTSPGDAGARGSSAKGLGRWLILLIAMIMTGGMAPYCQDEGAGITVNAAVTVSAVNPLLFGQNLVFAGNGLWDSRLNDIDPAARPLLKPIRPSLVRFPGGSASDQYLWEDGIGLKTTSPVTPSSTTITLDGNPDWQTVEAARLVDACGGRLGDRFSFLRREGNRLEGVFGIHGFHPAGVWVRPEARRGQPEWFSNSCGTMEYLKLVQSLKAQPLFTVNYSTGLDREGQLSTRVSLSQKTKRAAAWVAMVNGSPDDPRPLGVDEEGHDWRTVGFWAKKRLALGYPWPFGVIYWEVGNEVYDKNEVGVTAARRYAQDFIAFAKAMKGVDPRIRVGAVGLTRPRGQGDADTAAAWNPTVVKVAGDYLDFLIIHPYYPAGGEDQASYQGVPWLTAVMAGAHQALADLREIRGVIAANAPPGKSIGIAVTEYGIWPAASHDPRDYANLARALYDADLLLGLLQGGSRLGVILAASWNLCGSNPTAAMGYNWQTGIRTLRPHYHALALIMKHLGPGVLETRVSSPTFAVPRVANVKAAAAVPLLHAVAFSSPARQHLSLMVVNRSLSEAMPTTIRFQGFTPQAEARVWTLTGDRATDHNEDLAGTVAPRSGCIRDAGADFSYIFEPHSLTVMEFQARP